MSPGIKNSILIPPSKTDDVILGKEDKDGVLFIKAHNTFKYIIMYNRTIDYAEINVDISYRFVEIYTYPN
jgi:hypothetical protein